MGPNFDLGGEFCIQESSLVLSTFVHSIRIPLNSSLEIKLF